MLPISLSLHCGLCTLSVEFSELFSRFRFLLFSIFSLHPCEDYPALTDKKEGGYQVEIQQQFLRPDEIFLFLITLLMFQKYTLTASTIRVQFSVSHFTSFVKTLLSDIKNKINLRDIFFSQFSFELSVIFSVISNCCNIFLLFSGTHRTFTRIILLLNIID